jgi:beta-lactamase class A
MSGADAALTRRLERIAWDETGHVGIVCRDLATGREVRAGEPDRLFPLASCFKVPLLACLEAMAEGGELDWRERHVLADRDKSPGSGILIDLADGLDLSLNDLAFLMMTLSDNTATDILFARAGRARIAAFLRDAGVGPMSVVTDCKTLLADYVGVPVEAILAADPAGKQALLRRPPSPSTRVFAPSLAEANVASAVAMADLLAGIAAARLLGRARADHMLGIMAREWYRHRIPARLPAGVGWATKSGSIGHVLNDVGIVQGPRGPIVFVMLASDLAHPERWERVIARAARAAFDAFTRPDGAA